MKFKFSMENNDHEYGSNVYHEFNSDYGDIRDLVYMFSRFLDGCGYKHNLRYDEKGPILSPCTKEFSENYSVVKNSANETS